MTLTPVEREIVYMLGFEPKHVPLLSGIKICQYEKMIFISAPDHLDAATDAAGSAPHSSARSHAADQSNKIDAKPAFRAPSVSGLCTNLIGINSLTNRI
jgi:hypothetical protein